MANLDALRQQVQANTSVVSSAVALLTGLSAKIAELEPTQEAIDALASELDAASDSLAEAVAANTPDTPADPNQPI